jgi:prepilin-type N-terminal cleavage/methylation domain-containing protein
MSMSKTKGFTLLEIMVTLMVMAIVAAMATPSLREFVLRSQIRSATGDLVTSFALARSEAILRGANVAVCAMDADQAVQAQCLAATPGQSLCKVDVSTDFFERGWLVVESPNCAVADAIVEEKILRKFEPRPEIVFDSTPAEGGLVFRANGTLMAPPRDIVGDDNHGLAFKVNNQPLLKRRVQVSFLGRIKVACPSGSTPPACL